MSKSPTRSRNLLLRDDELRKTVRILVNALLDLHDETDPKHRKRSEEDKLERARLAVHVWWRLYGHLMLWVQSHLTGYYIARDNPKFVDRLMKIRGAEQDQDSHELELLGLLYAINPPSSASTAVDTLSKRLEGVEGGLNDGNLRRVIDELHLSVDANSSFWRFPLGRALRALNYGEKDPFFEPLKSKARGQAYTLAYQRALAVSHVYYRQGKGTKKYVALQEVANALSVSSETIRDWEKNLKKDDYFRLDWDAAFLAGEIEGKKDTMTRSQLDQQYTEWQFGSRTNVDSAFIFLDWSKNQWSLASIKEALRKGHQKRSHRR